MLAYIYQHHGSYGNCKMTTNSTDSTVLCSPSLTILAKREPQVPKRLAKEKLSTAPVGLKWRTPQANCFPTQKLAPSIYMGFLDGWSPIVRKSLQLQVSSSAMLLDELLQGFEALRVSWGTVNWMYWRERLRETMVLAPQKKGVSKANKNCRPFI